MARTALTPTELVPNGRVTRPTGTVGIADGHYVAGLKSEEFFLDITVATAETDVTIKAGDYPPALESVQGDEVLTCAIGSHYAGPFTSARFQKAPTLTDPGGIWIDYETPANVTVRVVHVPRTA
jgi:hypothetical protein